jgi:DMSO/TMAO reductase YedYZ molybdopterin-dependent catalytic subunit
MQTLPDHVVNNERRNFLISAAKGIILSAFAGGNLLTAVKRACAAVDRKMLPKGTDLQGLIDENPANLDASNLEIMPLEKFGTMGLTNFQVDIKSWRLEIKGHVGKLISFDYSEILALPVIERPVLLICPGFFVNYGLWKGVSVQQILHRAEVKPGATHVEFQGPNGPQSLVHSFPIKDVESDKVFLAYGVNGQPLPEKHGFPLRVVARDYYGSNWIKYVAKMEVKT